jgi:long-chain fatty acid transport protein
MNHFSRQNKVIIGRLILNMQPVAGWHRRCLAFGMTSNRIKPAAKKCPAIGQTVSNWWRILADEKSETKPMQIKAEWTLLPQHRQKYASRFLWLSAITFLSAAACLQAEGFRNPPPGTFDLGRAGGRVAQVDDSSAVQQNPANLMDVTNLEAQLTPTVVYISSDFHSSGTGQSATTKDPWKLLPNFFVSAPLKNDRFAVGLGVTVPYGVGNEWNQSSSAFTPYSGSWRYQAPYKTELQTINFNPTFAMRVCDKLSIGVGLDVMWSDITFHQYYPWFVFPGSGGTEPDGDAKATGSGVGYGGNLGVTLNITDHQRVAFTVRSPMDVDYNGQFTINNITPTAAFLGAKPSSDFHTQIKYPTIVSVGYGIELTDTIRLEADAEWIQFSRFKSLDLNAGQNQFLLGASANNAENWHDTFTVGIGGDWKFAEHWVGRAGYQFYQSPVPDSTFSPTIPDADQNVFTVGLGYKRGHHSLEAAYGLDFYATRNISSDQNPAFNGKYTFNVHLFSFSYRYSF